MANIGREKELQELLGIAEETRAGHGSVIFLAGSTGSGKSSLVKAFADSVSKAEGEERVDVVATTCYETGVDNPLGPFGEVLRALTNDGLRGKRVKRIRELMTEVSPDLVALIPVIGKFAALGIKVVSGVYAAGANDESQQTQRAADVAGALQRVADDMPLFVVIDDAQWMDAASTEVIARVAHADAERRLSLVIAYDDSLLDDRHPLARVRATIIGRSGVKKLALDDLNVHAVEAILRDRYGAVPGEGLAEWLQDRTNGSLLFVDQFLATIEDKGVLHRDEAGWVLDGTIEGEPGDWRLSGAIADLDTPDDLLELLRPRVADLDQDERSLLETGAVQGRRFLSTLIVRMLNREEDEILDRLTEVAQRRRMISPVDVEDWWSDRSALYAFDPGVLQELLYGRYERSPYERRRRHLAVAEGLEALVANDHPPARQALLEIARNYEEAREPRKAATRLLEVADSTFAEGAYRETATHAERALAILREVSPDQLDPDSRREIQRLLVQAILLLLLSGRSNLPKDPSHDPGERELLLAEEAESLAESVDDPKLKANVRYAKGSVLVAHGELAQAITAYREALDLARAAGDQEAEFAILSALGHHLDSVNLREGWKILQEAHALLAGGGLADRLDGERQRVESARLETRLGVGAFDFGRYGEAQELLVGSARELREGRHLEDAAWSLGFLAQLYTAIGLCEAAEATLGDAIGLLADQHETLGLRGYLRALLGHLYLEWDPPRRADARAVLASGREEVAAAEFHSVVSLVEAFWGELLISEGNAAGLREADETLKAASSFGWARGEIATSSMRARVALAEGRVHDAVALSNQAVSELKKRGGAVPAVRSEEILFTHAQALAAEGSPEAGNYYAEAARVVREKAESLTDTAQRDSFVKRVRLSREILRSVEPGEP